MLCSSLHTESSQLVGKSEICERLVPIIRLMGITYAYHLQPDPKSGIKGYMLAVEVGKSEVGHPRDVNFSTVSGYLVREPIVPSVVQSSNGRESTHPKPLGQAIVIVKGKCWYKTGYGVFVNGLRPAHRTIVSVIVMEWTVEIVDLTYGTVVETYRRIADIELEFVTRQFRRERLVFMFLFVSVESVDVGCLQIEVGVAGEKSPFALHVTACIFVLVCAIRHMLEPHIRPDGTTQQVTVGQAVVEADVCNQGCIPASQTDILVGGHPHISFYGLQVISHGKFRP